MHTIIASRTTLFPLGIVCATRGAVDALNRAGQSHSTFLLRHAVGDWGVLDDHDREANRVALERGGRLFSAYTTSLGARLYIITECDRSATTLLLPSEY